jgi:CAAX protease family protein
MSVLTSAADTPGEPTSASKNLMVRHPYVSFFVILSAGVWLVYLPLILGQNGLGFLPYTIPIPAVLFNLPASLAGPLLAGYIMSRVTGGKEGARQFRGRVFRWRVGWQWYLLALAGMPVLGLLSATVLLGVSPVVAVGNQFLTFLGSYLLLTLVTFALVNLWEEGGLMGYGQPAL